MKGIGKILKQAQKMQSKMAELQEELAGRTVEASSGGGMVAVVANGQQQIVSIKIDPDVLEEPDAEMLEDLITTAVNAALQKVQEMVQEEMGKLTGGLGLPPGLM